MKKNCLDKHTLNCNDTDIRQGTVVRKLLKRFLSENELTNNIT